MRSMNAVYTVYPTRNKFGIWAFDDSNRGLKQEPLVGNTNIVIDNMALDSGYSLDEQIPLMFSPFPIPNYQVALVLLESSDNGGSFYRSNEYDMTIWLCPALFKYLPVAPKVLYGKVGI